MKTSKPKTSDKSDEDLADTLLGADHRESFKHHVEQATRNFSVEVHQATQLRRRSRSVIPWYVWPVVGAACVLIVWVNLKPKHQSIPQQNTTETPLLLSPPIEASSDIINEFVDDEVVEHLADLPPQSTHIVTSKDVDFLFEDL